MVPIPNAFGKTKHGWAAALCQAMVEVKQYREKFCVAQPLENEAKWEATARLARVTFVEGLLIHAFVSATDKVSLRTSVQGNLKLLGKRIPKADLVPAVRAGAEAAMQSKVNV